VNGHQRTMTLLRASRELVFTYVKRRGPLLAQGVAYSLLLGSTPLLLLSLTAASLLYELVPQVQGGIRAILMDYVPDPAATQILEHVQMLTGAWARMGVLGLVLLVTVSKGMFDSLAGGLAGVMGGERRIHALLQHTASLLMTFLAIIFVIVASLDEPLLEVLFQTANLPRTALLYKAAAATLSILLLAIVLVLVYTVFATRSVRLQRVMGVAVMVSVVWYAVGRLGKMFVVLFARYNLVYGVFSGAVLFLVWLQLFAHLILLGGLFASRKWHALVEPAEPPPPPPL
jgi:YihY family inner membrane protein